MALIKKKTFEPTVRLASHPETATTPRCKLESRTCRTGGVYHFLIANSVQEWVTMGRAARLFCFWIESLSLGSAYLGLRDVRLLGSIVLREMNVDRVNPY